MPPSHPIKKRNPLPLGVQLSLPGVVVMFSVALAFSWWTARQQADHATQALLEHSHYAAQHLAKAAQQHLADGAASALEPLLLEWVGPDQPRTIQVLDATGLVLRTVHYTAHREPSLMPGGGHRDVPTVAAPQAKLLEDTLELWHPFPASGAPGWVHMVLSLEGIQAQVTRIWRDTFVGAGLIYLVATLALMLTLQLRMHPLRKVAQFAAALGTHRGGVLNIGNTNRETQQVIDALNRASVQLHEQEVALQAHSGRLRAVLQHAAAAIIGVDEHGRIESCNPAAERIFGLTEQALLGRDMRGLIPTLNDAEVLAELRQQSLAAGGVGTTAQPMAAVRGHGQNFATEVSLSRPDVSRPTAYTLFLRDVTERERAETELKDSHRLLRTVLDTIPQQVFVKDRDARFLMVNKAWGDFYGIAPEEARQYTTHDLPVASPEQLNETLDGDQRVLAGEPLWDITHTMRLADGREQVRRLYKAPLRNATGEIVGIVGFSEDITARVRAEEAVHRSHESLDRAQQIGRFGSWELNPVSGEMEWSDEMFRIMGFTPGEVNPTDDVAQATLPPEVREQLAPLMEEAMQRGGSFEMEHPIIRKDGVQRHVRQVGQVYLDAAGNPKRVSAVMVDITERMQAQEAVRRSRESLDRAQQIGHLGSWDWDIVAGSLAWSDEIYRIFGLSPQEFGATYSAFLEYIHPDDRDAVAAAVGAAVEGTTPYDIVHRVVKPTGSERVVHERGEVFRDQAGTPLRMLGTVHDITEQVEAQRELNRFKTTLDRTHDSVFMFEPDTLRFFYVNQGAAEQFGYALESWLSMTPMELAPEYTEASFREMLAPLLEGDERAHHFETVARHDDGGEIPVEVTLQYVAPDGEPARFVAIVRNITERLETQRWLEDSQQLLQGVFDALPIWLSVKDRNFRYLMVNRQTLEDTGLTLADYMNTPTEDLPLGEGEEMRRNRNLDQVVLRTGERVVSPEHPHTFSDGTLHYFHHMKSPYYDADGNVAGIVTASVDLTERKRAEEAVQRSQESLSMAQSIAHLGNWDWDMTHGRFTMSEEMLNILGLPLESTADRYEHFLEMVHPEDCNAVMRAINDAIGRAEPLKMEHRVRRSDGTVRHVSEQGEVYRDENGHPVRMMGTVQDITESKLAEQRLLDSEARFRDLTEGSVQGMVVHRNTRPLYANDAYARIFGFDSPEQVLELDSLGVLIHPDDRGEVVANVTRFVEGTAPEQQYATVRAVRRDGAEIYLEAVRRVIQWDGRLAVQTTVIDVTERQRLEEQLRQAQKMEAVGTLAGGVAHDFNNMLQIVSSLTEVAINKAQKGKDPSSTLEKVLTAAADASNLTRQLMALSRREALRHQDINLNTLIAGIAAPLRSALGAGPELEIVPAEDLAVTRGDPGMVQQVLLNLASNAGDALGGSGRLTVSTANFIPDASFRSRHGWAEDKPYVQITVSDTGVGIAEDVIEKIFEPFFSTKETGQGSGLGLSMAYGILRQHRGMIEAESTPGEGAHFHIYLPAVRETAPKGQPPKPTSPKAAPGPAAAGETPAASQAVTKARAQANATILIADDDENIRRLLEDLLKTRGYRVLAAADGEEALAVFADHAAEVRLVILDMMMPRLSGRDVFDRMREQRPDLPVLFSTGYKVEHLDQDFVANNSFGLLHKPFRPAELFRAMEEALEIPGRPENTSAG